jgi:NAD(P)H-flavin reductase
MTDRDDTMDPRKYVIRGVNGETYDTFTFELEPAEGDGMPPFEPGQFNMVYVYGVGEVPISLSGDPAESKSLLHTVRSVGTVTGAIEKMKKGDVLGIRGPFGTHWPVKDANGKDVVIVAGGIGLAPLRPAMYQLASLRENCGKIFLLYGARTPQDLLYMDEIKKLCKGHDIVFDVTVDEAKDAWDGKVGVVTTLIPGADFNPDNTLAMVCGPEIMMRFTIQELQKKGLKDGDIFISMERNMKCGIGLCGHCQLGPFFICKDGPVFRFDRISELFRKKEV